ncbi:hypothetical protein [Streptomyces erythrochromogenes]|uniref:hypothetical protein n=1 Tax=Streptomyces erythrochromogenes TaxID=285574 RepID=UPI0036B4ABB4
MNERPASGIPRIVLSCRTPTGAFRRKVTRSRIDVHAHLGTAKYLDRLERLE